MAETTTETPLQADASFSVPTFGTGTFLGGSTERTNLEYKDLNLTLRTKKGVKVILDDVSGLIQGGRLTALMGPSGSGKTSYV
jgi:ABC-type transport system involved in cytochrome bd biosynthesis fused ATPase/permease subunit